MQLKEISVIYNRLKSSAKKRGIVFTITKADLWEIDVPITCPILGIPMKVDISRKLSDNSISYDRIDNSKGYEVDNLMILSYRANRLKSDASLQEMKLLAEFYSNVDTSIPICSN